MVSFVPFDLGHTYETFLFYDGSFKSRGHCKVLSMKTQDGGRGTSDDIVHTRVEAEYIYRPPTIVKAKRIPYYSFVLVIYSV